MTITKRCEKGSRTQTKTILEDKTKKEYKMFSDVKKDLGTKNTCFG